METAPTFYDAWYNTARGSWIAQQEFSAGLKLITPIRGQTVLDVGSGTGYFSQQFKQAGLNVTGLDSSLVMNQYASAKYKDIEFIHAEATKLPFADNSFDYSSAIMSLCFIANPKKALAEMWRVSRRSVVLGLLNRHSLLYYMKRKSKGYHGARWDTLESIQQWVKHLQPTAKLKYQSAIWLPKGDTCARFIEKIAPAQYPYAGFLAVYLEK